MMMMARSVSLLMEDEAHLGADVHEVVDFEPDLVDELVVALVAVDLGGLAVLADVAVLVDEVGGDWAAAVAVALYVVRTQARVRE